MTSNAPWRSAAGTHVLSVFLATCAACDATFTDTPQANDPSQGWELAADPSVSIGVRNGPQEYQFSNVQAVVQLTSGHLVIADGGTRELRLYDRHGAHARTTGGRGGGPGEFGILSWATRIRGDTILAWDAMLRRFTLFDAAGEYAGQYAVMDSVPYRFREVGAPGVIVLPGALEDGSVVLKPEPLVSTLTAGDAGFYQDTVPVMLWKRSGAVVPLGEYSDNSRIIAEGRAIFVPVAGMLRCAIGDDRVACGSGTPYRLRIVDSEGKSLTEIARETADLETTDRAMRQFKERILERSDPSTHPSIAEMLEGASLPRSPVGYDAMMYGSGGGLWVRRYADAGSDRATWDVFDHNGAFERVVQVPSEVQVMAAGEWYVVGIVRDSFDVEQVRVYEVIRSQEVGTSSES